MRIVVTRAAHQAEDLASLLRALGAEVIFLPVIRIVPPADPEPLRHAIANCDEYEWIIFTSANAVAAFDAQPRKAQIATIGSATRNAAEARGLTVRLTPEKYVADALVQVFAGEKLSGSRILIPSAAVTRDVVAPELRKRGAQVDVVEAYRNILPADAAAVAAKVFREPYPDWVTFASPSAVDNLVSLTGIESLQQVKIATIGPVTSDAVRKYGLNIAAEAAIQSAEGLAAVVAEADDSIGHTKVEAS